jgi:hypothetical protein
VGCEKQRLFSSCPSRVQWSKPSHPGQAFRRSSAPEGLGTARFSLLVSHSNGSNQPWKKRTPRPRRRLWALVQLHPPNPPPRPASGSHRLPNKLGQVGEQYAGPVVDRPIMPHLRVLAVPIFTTFKAIFRRRGSARVVHTGQFSCFGPRSCFIAFVLDIPNGFWPLGRAVGRAYIRIIRETVPNQRARAASPCYLCVAAVRSAASEEVVEKRFTRPPQLAAPRTVPHVVLRLASKRRLPVLKTKEGTSKRSCFLRTTCFLAKRRAVQPHLLNADEPRFVGASCLRGYRVRPGGARVVEERSGRGKPEQVQAVPLLGRWFATEKVQAGKNERSAGENGRADRQNGRSVLFIAN